MWEICCSRLAPIRFVPFSYFCTCWKVSPSFSPSFSWLIPSISRRMRTREPTYLSVGFGDFFAIISVCRNVRLEEKRPGQKWRNKAKLRRGKVHRSSGSLSLKQSRGFVRWYLTCWRGSIGAALGRTHRKVLRKFAPAQLHLNPFALHNCFQKLSPKLGL